MPRGFRGRTRFLVLGLLLSICGLTTAAPVSAAQSSGRENLSTMSRLPAGSVDLAVNQITMTVGPACVGDRLIFLAQISNLGIDTSRWFTYQWFVDGRPSLPLLHRGLDSGGQATIMFHIPAFSVGSHEVRLQLDPRNRISETDDVNNWFSLAFRVFDTSNPACPA